MHYVTGEDLKDVRLQARYSKETAAALCGVNLKTWQRWEAGRHRIPWAAYQLIRIIGLGDRLAVHRWEAVGSYR